ncbi:aldose 1-epimerase family protein [Companilactobacillus muriivasis]|uniref:aldose 1-epimerase family protein n=1 Tax=Companilactobacillus muriivasis TaxID=3081444 RepID=UPI0030C6FF06
MRYELKNEFLTVQVSSIGSELQSIKNVSGLEYVWQVDKDVWPRQAPILFPIVGRLNDDHYYVEGREYKMTQHGFARDQEFTLISNTDSKLVLRLKDNEESHKIYPYKFELTVTYLLNGINVSVSYVVKNIDQNKVLYFSIGAHPGFKVPMDEKLSYEDFKIGFSPKEKRVTIPVAGHSADVRNSHETANQDFNLNREAFKKDALIYELTSATDISLTSPSTDHKVIFNTGNAKYVGLWSTYPTEGKFICIEPWWGLADTPESDGQFISKKAINKLESNDEFEAHYSINIE